MYALLWKVAGTKHARSSDPAFPDDLAAHAERWPDKIAGGSSNGPYTAMSQTDRDCHPKTHKPRGAKAFRPLGRGGVKVC